ncbi:hypothetical protein [Micromonospora coerulea]|uniref:hypothetical protein n=1 Tax=Micromonospora coerulea TaxID=47856 RepID=UPI0019046216|nr:hypothetical protein [Micromonospora veneta]
MIIHSREVARIAAAALVAMLCGACGTGQREAAKPPQEATSAAPAAPQHESRSPTPDGPAVLPWVSAVVARDDTSITVATGIASVVCGEPTRPKATITYQDDTQVVISVTSSILRAEKELCATDGNAAPAFVSLQKPLGDRVLRDAATTRLHPTYFERDLPDLLADKRWDPSGRDLGPGESRARPGAVVATGPPPGGWVQSFRDPDGAVLSLDARPTARVHRPTTIGTVPIGSRRGIITTYGGPGFPWAVWWEAGQVTYSLTLTPPVGRDLPLKQFKQQLARFKWS